MKTCVKCSAEKPLSEFYAKRANRDGLRHECKVCSRAATKAHQAANPEHYAEYRRDTAESKREYQREYYAKEENKARRSSYLAKWRNDNRERLARATRKHRELHPEGNRQTVKRYRVRKRTPGVAATLTLREWQATLDYFGNACAYCLATGVKLTQDHVVPISKGGEHTPDNVVPACQMCNSRKSNNTLLGFMLMVGRDIVTSSNRL